MKKYILAIILTAALVLNIDANAAFANSLDAYRQMIQNGQYTIRYENVMPSSHVTNRDRIELFGSSGLAVAQNDYLVDKPLIGLIVASAQDRYEEVGDGIFDMCRLTRGDENFFFTRKTDGEHVKYYGEKRNEVRAQVRNRLAEAVEGKSFGDDDMTRLIYAMLPNNLKSANMPHYTHVKSGKLKDGLKYEDYKSTDGGAMSAIRYYFDGDRLVKIAAADYREGSDGKIESSRCVVNVLEFKSKAEEKYLTLPSALKDVTKRKKVG
ncbi:MAG: hypothetical protein IJU71_06725 [Selenomonadaceae bacterium]|nr:hypothetical protein [Selenomonadaceae bacterium]